MREITVIERSSVQAGSCNACTNHNTKTGVSPHTIWEVTLRSIGFRLCAECKKELLRKLK